MFPRRAPTTAGDGRRVTVAEHTEGRRRGRKLEQNLYPIRRCDGSRWGWSQAMLRRCSGIVDTGAWAMRLPRCNHLICTPLRTLGRAYSLCVATMLMVCLCGLLLTLAERILFVLFRCRRRCVTLCYKCPQTPPVTPERRNQCLKLSGGSVLSPTTSEYSSRSLSFVPTTAVFALRIIPYPPQIPPFVYVGVDSSSLRVWGGQSERFEHNNVGYKLIIENQ